MPGSPDGPFARYAVEREERDRSAGAAGAGAVRRWLRAALPRRAREAARRALTRLLTPWSIRRARVLGRARPLRLHLACGSVRLSGWINVDLAGGRAELPWDLRRRLPFADGSVEAVFAEHLLEHLTLDEALALGREIHRLLAPGGVLRLGVPDFRRYAAAYLGRDDVIERYRPGRPTPLLALSEVVYLHGHRSAWDEETLTALLREVGFGSAAARAFGDSAIEPAPDTPARRPETLYVEAIR